MQVCCLNLLFFRSTFSLPQHVQLLFCFASVFCDCIPYTHKKCANILFFSLLFQLQFTNCKQRINTTRNFFINRFSIFLIETEIVGSERNSAFSRFSFYLVMQFYLFIVGILFKTNFCYFKQFLNILKEIFAAQHFCPFYSY